MNLKDITIGILIGSTSMTSIAGTMMISVPDKTQIGFEKMDDAAKAGEAIAMKKSDEFEFGGALYQLNGKFFYTIAVISRDPRAVDYKISLPKGAKMVAMYHTHPDSSTSADGFSDSDIQTANRMKMPMYIGVVTKNHVLKYDPSTDIVILGRGMNNFHPSPI